MAITFPITGVTSTYSSTRSPSFTLGTAPQTDDVIVALVGTGTSGATTDTSGWTNALGANTVATPSDTSCASVLVYHRVTSGESGGGTVTWTLTDLWNSVETGRISALVLRGVKTSAELVGTSSASDPDAATPWVIPSVTPTADDCQIVAGVIGDSSQAADPTDPSGWTRRVSGTTSYASHIYTRDALGENGVPTATANVTPNAGDEYVIIVAAFADATTTVTAQVGLLSLSAVPGYASAPTTQTVTAQVANLALTAVPGSASTSSPQTVNAQVAALTLVAPTGTVGGLYVQPAQVGVLSLSAIPGTVTSVYVVTAQVATLRLEALHAEPAWLPGVIFTGTGILTVTINSTVITSGTGGSSSGGGSGSGFGAYLADGERPRYRVLLVDQNGVGVATLANAALTTIEWSLNEPESFSFLLPTLDPYGLLIETPGTEVQVWRGDQLLVWGVVVRSMADMSTTEFQCRGLGWYFGKRVVGAAEQNYVLNASFENGPWDWWIEYAPTEPSAGQDPTKASAAVSSDISLTGAPGRSMKIIGNGSKSTDSNGNITVNPDNIFGISALSLFSYTVDPATEPEGVVWTATAWVYVSSVWWVGERVCAYNWGGDSAPAGLTIRRISPTEEDALAPIAGMPKLYETQIAPISDDLPRDQWVRLEVSLTAPADPSPRPDLIQVGLSCPVGIVYWDEVTCTRNEHLIYHDLDQATIVENLVVHAQDTVYGKSDLNIATHCPPTGVVRSRTYEFFNHDIIDQAVLEFTELWRGVDWSIECTATTRTFTTYFPMKGTFRPAQALVLGKNIGSLSYASNGEEVANRVIAMADLGGTGSSREEAYATDSSGFASGLVLEVATNAIKDSTLHTLQDQADRAMRQYRVPVNIPKVTTYEGRGGELLGVISVGDVVPVVADHGTMSMDGDFRIIGISLDPESETMELTLNPFEEWNDPTRDWGVVV